MTVESMKNAIPKILVKSNPNEKVWDKRVFQLFRTSRPCGKWGKRYTEIHEDSFPTKQIVFAKRFPSLSTANKHFFENDLLIANSRTKNFPLTSLPKEIPKKIKNRKSANQDQQKRNEEIYPICKVSFQAFFLTLQQNFRFILSSNKI